MGLFNIFKTSLSKTSVPLSTNYANKYYKGMEEIQSMWSVLYNLKIINGEQSDIFEQKCYENISDLKNMIQIEKKTGFNTVPREVPAYVRLAMLYEKQGKYQKGIDICVEAIKLGAIEDNSKGKMYGRLARLIKKSGIQVDKDILKLAQESR